MSDMVHAPPDPCPPGMRVLPVYRHLCRMSFAADAPNTGRVGRYYAFEAHVEPHTINLPDREIQVQGLYASDPLIILFAKDGCVLNRTRRPDQGRQLLLWIDPNTSMLAATALGVADGARLPHLMRRLDGDPLSYVWSPDRLVPGTVALRLPTGLSPADLTAPKKIHEVEG